MGKTAKGRFTSLFYAGAAISSSPSCVRQVLQIGLVIPVSGSSLICLLRALRVWLFGNIPPPRGGGALRQTDTPSFGSFVK